MSANGAMIGKIRTDIQKSIVNSIEFTLDEHGCSSFTMKLNTLPSFPILPFSIISINVGNTENNWYAGEVSYQDDIGTDQEIYEYSGVGLRNYLKTLKAQQTYTAGQDVGVIINDLAENWISPYAPIIYNEDKIWQTTGVITANDIELSNAPLEKVIQTFADMAGADWGVDGDRYFYFLQRDTETIQRTLFVGYQIQNFKPKYNLQEVKNSIIVQRQQGAADGGAGWVIAGIFNDDSSIKKYGQKQLQYQVPGFFNDNDCNVIGNALVNDLSEPKLSGTVQNYHVSSGADFFDLGLYRIINPFGNFKFIYNACDNIYQWDLYTTGDLVAVDDTDYFIYGSGSIYLSWTSANTDRIEFVSVQKFGKLKNVRVYIRSSSQGNFIKVGVGNGQWNDYMVNVEIPQKNIFYNFDWYLENDNITEIDRIGFQVDTANPGNIWIDKIEFEIYGNPHYDLVFKQVKYSFTPENQVANIDFGTVPPREADYINALFSTASELRFTQEVI